MNRCRLCVMPDTRPDVPFVDGICAACISYAKRPTIDWGGRKADLALLLERGRNGSGFDCIVPSSGGKDSHYQVLTLIEMGAKPLVVTATTCHLTPIGRMNIENLGRYAATIELTPNRTVRAKLNRLGIELVGDPSWPEHVSIFTTPFRVAADLGIPLIFYGENPQNQYGGPPGTEEARQMTRRWRAEFGGFNGLRPADMVGKLGITRADMLEYEMPLTDQTNGRHTLNDQGPALEAHFLGQYLPWDSHKNAEIAAAAGMIQGRPSEANWWHHENLDNAQTGLHDHFMYRKYGYGRGCAQISVDVRSGRVSRERALAWVLEHDRLLPRYYGGIALEAILARIGMTYEDLHSHFDAWTNWDIMRRVEDRFDAIPIPI